MAAANYATDLIDINLGTGSWSEPVGATAGGAPGAETDYFIEGTACISKSYNASGLGGQCIVLGSPVTITSPAASFHWLYWGAPNTLASLASGGYRILMGSTSNNYKMWYVLGNDTYTYGGWVCIPVDPTVTPDATYSSPTSTTQVFGSVVNNSNNVAKGNPYGNDAIRYGRELRVTLGDSGTPATFTGAAAADDTVTTRWGLFRPITGGYLQQGLFVMGLAASAVYFDDSNKNISIANTTKVTSAFNAFEVRNASSTVKWTSISITSLSTVSRGNFITTDNAAITLTSCTFTDMGTFGFLGNTTATSCIFRRCNLITQSSAIFTSCTFDNTNDATRALLSNNLTNVSSCVFNKTSGTGYAIELNTATGATYYIDGSDAAATDPQSVWTNDSEAFNGDTTTGATASTVGSTSSNYLMAEGTNAPGSGSSITNVYARIYGSVASGDTLSATIYTNTLGESLGTISNTSTSAAWSTPYTLLSTPTGGWDWTKAQALEAKIYKTGTAGTATAYRIDIAVMTGGYTSTGNDFIGYASTDGSTGNEVIYNNSGGTILISVASGDTPTVRNGTSANTIVVSSATVTIHVEDINRNNIQSARVYVTRDADSSIIINSELTNSSGNVSGSTVAGAGIINVSVRKSSTGSTKYIPVATTGNVTGTTLTVNVILTQDSIAAT